MRYLTVRNLTPHLVALYKLGEGSPCRVLPPDGAAPRVSVSTSPTREVVEGGIPVVTETQGAVTGLPDPVDGVLLIVSRPVVQACPDRADLVVPTDYVRDATGRIIGCRALARLTSGGTEK